MRVVFTRTETRELSAQELRDATLEYLQTYVMNGKYLNKDGILENWEDTGHGSGITNHFGPPSPRQKAAWTIIQSIREEKGKY